MGRQGKGISISTMQKGAILRKCVNTFVPHCRFSSGAKIFGHVSNSTEVLRMCLAC